MRIAETVKKIGNGIIILILAIVLIGNCSILFSKFVLQNPQPGFAGYSTAVVISGSMSGSIEINDMIIIHEEDTYTPGDIITFKSGSSLVTHRIIDETEDGFITKGDANNSEDLHPVPFDNVVGKVILIIPKAGAVIQFLQTPLGMTILLGIALLMIFLPRMQADKDDDEGGSTYE